MVEDWNLVKIFHRSEENYDVKYIHYVGDGNSKRIPEIS